MEVISSDHNPSDRGLASPGNDGFSALVTTPRVFPEKEECDGFSALVTTPRVFPEKEECIVICVEKMS